MENLQDGLPISSADDDSVHIHVQLTPLEPVPILLRLTMEPSTVLVVCLIVLCATIANCYPKGEISTANGKTLIVDSHVKGVENGTIGKYD